MGKHKNRNRGQDGQKPSEADVLALAQSETEKAEATPETPEETSETEETTAETVEPAETVAEKPAEGGDTEEKEEEAPALSLADLVRNAKGITEEQRKKLLDEAEKLDQAETRSKQAKNMVEFNKELEVELPRWLEELRAKHDVNLEGRRITVYFPKEGEDKTPKLTSAAKGNGDGNGNREGFPTKWGKAVVIKDGKETIHDSPSKAAESLGQREALLPTSKLGT